MSRDYDMSSILGVEFEETPETLAYDLSSKFSSQVMVELDSRGMSMRELAEKMGIKQPTLTRMLGPKSNMTLKTVARIALALGCDVEEPKLEREEPESNVIEFPLGRRSHDLGFTSGSTEGEIAEGSFEFDYEREEC